MENIKKQTILCVDDDKKNLELLEACLSLKGYNLKFSESGADALAQITKEPPDLILLDVMMPGTSGLKICKELKASERFSSIPIIILSAKTEESDKVSGLDIGADDYIVKPFSEPELDSRIRAVLRRTKGEPAEEQIRVGDTLGMDLQKYEVTALGKKIPLTALEFTLLRLLASRKGQVFSRARILDYIWGSAVGVTERTVDVHVSHLREKLGESGKLIKNIRGVGYKIDDTKEDA
jgi:two-component system phosphate regulon response regulator PhoB/two-component system alkaline phosphatase synthesis response regulator PhoP